MARSVRKKTATCANVSRPASGAVRVTRSAKRKNDKRPKLSNNEDQDQALTAAVAEDKATTFLTAGTRSTGNSAESDLPSHVPPATDMLTNHDGHNLPALNVDDIVAAVKNISYHASCVLDIFETKPESDDIDLTHHLGTSATKWFSTALGRMEEDLEPWRQPSAVFLSVDHITRTFPARVLPPGVEEIFLKANLALFMGELVKSAATEKAVQTQLLQTLSTNERFPTLFLNLDHASELIAPPFHQHTADTASTLLILYYISNYEGDMNSIQFNRDTCLEQVFARSEDPWQRSAYSQHRALLKLTVPGVMNTLRKLTPPRSSPPANLKLLKQRYPWVKAANELATWAKATHRLLNDVIAAQGGVEKLLDDLKQTPVPGNADLYKLDIEHSSPSQAVDSPDSNHQSQRERTLPLSEIDDSPDTHQAEAGELLVKNRDDSLCAARNQTLQNEQISESIIPPLQSTTRYPEGDAHQGDTARNSRTTTTEATPPRSTTEQPQQGLNVPTGREVSRTPTTVPTQVTSRKKRKRSATHDDEFIDCQAKGTNMNAIVRSSKRPRTRTRTSKGTKENNDDEPRAEEHSRKTAGLDRGRGSTEGTTRRAVASTSEKKVYKSLQQTGNPIFLPR